MRRRASEAHGRPAFVHAARAAGTFTREDGAGPNTFRVTGRVRTGGRIRALSAASYVLKVVAKLGSRSSATAQMRFTITL